ncbi:MAG: hypothetical protein LBE24_10465 [Methylobacillus sp.]|jgi:membrane-bound ClpP family serine protease|nr:hypothetical protein [Methylobacillus sp.]
MPFIYRYLVLMLCGTLLVACELNSDVPTNSATTAEVDRKAPSLFAQPVPLKSGYALLSCDPDYNNRIDHPISLVDMDVIRPLVHACVDNDNLHIYYNGVINNELQSLMKALTVAATEEGIQYHTLEIDSPGGEIDAALSIGDELWNGDWGIWVKPGARCYSACVLLLAGATSRSMSDGSVGIHRMLNPKSQARTPDELQAELDLHLHSVKKYLTKYGANPALADLMMTVPSKELRILTQEEIRQFGLDGTNPVKADLARLDVARRCGDDFLRRWDNLKQLNEKECSITREGSTQKYIACLNRNYDRLGFPDPKCPYDGPARIPSP